jgi:hypothetical protein
MGFIAQRLKELFSPYDQFCDQKENMKIKLTDLEKMFLLECESNCGRDFPKCRNVDCGHHHPMNQALDKLGNHYKQIANSF